MTKDWKPYYAALKAENPLAYQQCLQIVEAHKQHMPWISVEDNRNVLTAYGELERSIVVHTCELLNIHPYSDED